MSGATKWMEKLRTALPNIEDRPSQAQYARSVEGALATAGHLVIEGPCGTGKSLGYLIPAIEFIRSRVEARVVLSTNSKALQDQIVKKDIPTAIRVAGDVSFALLKGRNNYVCPDRMQAAGKRIRGAFSSDEWNRLRACDAVDDFGSLEEKTRSAVVGSNDACDLRRCAGSNCPYGRARRAAQAARLVVVNHHLLVTDIAAEGTILGDYDALIVDEAHDFVDVARSVLGWRVTAGRFDALADAVERDAADFRTSGALRRAGLIVESAAKEIWTEGPGIRPLQEPKLAPYLAQIDEELVGVSLPDETLQRRLDKLLGETRTTLGVAFPERYVHWVEADRPCFQTRLLEPGSTIANYIYQRGTIFTSATMASGGAMDPLTGEIVGNFEYFVTDVGASDASTQAVESPFDFAKQARWFMPPELVVDPQHPDWSRNVQLLLPRLAHVSRGRMLLLSTSWERAAGYVEVLRDTGWKVLFQGEGSTQSLVHAFREAPGTILVGVASLWAGIDVPGEALSFLVVDRLPFTSPGDPVMDARSKLLGKDAFRRLTLPSAILRLRQGVGRLIRKADDRGAWCFLDRRIVDKGYGKAFRQALPWCPKVETWDELAAFLA